MTQRNDFAGGEPPAVACSRAVAAVARMLRDSGYSESGIRERLGVTAVGRLRAEGPAVLARRAVDTGALGVLLELFLAGRRVARAQVCAVLGETALAALSGCALVRESGDAVVATVELSPLGNLVFAHDRLDRHAAGAADHVLGPGPATRNLAEHTVRRPVRRTLDLGCGSGVLACLAARHSDHVVGTDLNARAVAFARFNAALNGIRNASFVEGDLFAPVAGQRFDLVVCNPPYVVSPAAAFLYRDGGPALCARIVQAAAGHLADSGTLQMAVNWPQRRGRDRQAEVRAWAQAPGCDGWLLAAPSVEPVTYAALWLRQQQLEEADFERELDEWLAHYRREEIESIGMGLLMLRAAGRRAPWFEMREAPPVSGPAGESIAGTLDARDAVARARDERELLDLVLEPAPGLERRVRHRPGGDGWERVSEEIRLGAGYCFAARLDPLGAALLGHFDGRRHVVDAADAFARSAGIPLEPLLAGLPELVRRLTWLGLLRPAT